MRIISDMNIAKKKDSDQGKRPLLLLTFILAFAGLAVWLTGPSPAAAQTTTVTIESVTTTINGCETLDVFIRINDVEGLYGADVLLTFDPEILAVDGLQELDDFLKPPFFIPRNEFNNTAGTVRLALTQLNPTPPATGSGNFARITFRAKGDGSNSPLQFSFAQLAGLGGAPIPATPVNGSLSTTPPAATTAAISKLNPTTARLSWNGVAGVDRYHIYRDTYAYFTPGTPYATVTSPGTTYDDANALGDVANNYFYVIRAACENGFESAISNRIGEFDYILETASYSNLFNMIGLPLDSTSLITPFQASGLINYVGGGVEQVLRWDSALQGYEFYDTFSPSFLNFPLTIGQAYLLETDSEVSPLLSLVGNVPLQGSVTFDFTLGSSSTCAFNSLTIPLDRTDITQASDLMADITGVEQVLKWNVVLQGYESYDGFGPFFTNFAVKAGYPYLVCLNNTAPNSWP